MKYAGAVVQCARVTVRNPFAVLLVSLATTASLLPLATGVVLAGSMGALVGLWTTSFMLGFVAVGGARIATVMLEREVSLGTEYFWEGVKRGTVMAPVVGLGTFLAALAALALSTVGGTTLIELSFDLLGVYVLLAWFVLATFALTLWAGFENPRSPRAAFVEGATLVLEEPTAAGWVLVQTVGWTLVAIPLVLATVLLLPGFVQVVTTAIVRRAADESPSHDPVVTGSA